MVVKCRENWTWHRRAILKVVLLHSKVYPLTLPILEVENAANSTLSNLRAEKAPKYLFGA